MTSPDTQELTRRVPATYRPDGCVEAITCLSPPEFRIRAEIPMSPSRVIPVLVVPGIMGTNLCKKGDPTTPVWRPPNGAGEGAAAARAGAFSDAARRQVAFVPDEAQVDASGPVSLPNDFRGLSAEQARTDRGWGALHWQSYGELLVYLETHLNHVYARKELQDEWAVLRKSQDGKRWGAQKPGAFEPVREEELMRMPRAYYPVYAAGYNWLQSNNESARALARRIDEIIARWSKGYSCHQVLLVTHSMGGLVARRCAQLQPDKILGVVHGVLPALGAAATYKRMRAGFEGAAAVVLGWNEAEATASVANAPGPLELLPQAAYNGGKPWLHVARRGRGRESHEEHNKAMLPLRDPYSEIYEKDAKTCWYGLVNSDLIDPAGLHALAGRVPWDTYRKNLARAKLFHEQLGDYYHPFTRAYYGADEAHMAWGTVKWHTTDAKAIGPTNLLEGSEPTSNGTGEVDIRLGNARVSFRLEPQDACGDGTVPADASGHHPSTSSSVQQCYRMGGFDHQYSYNNAQVRLALLHSLAQLTQRSTLLMKV